MASPPSCPALAPGGSGCPSCAAHLGTRQAPLKANASLVAQVWGSLADEESIALAQRLVRGAISPSVKPGEMHILDKPVRFTVHGASGPAGVG